MTILILRHTPGNTLGHLTEVLDAMALPYTYWDAYQMAPAAFKPPSPLTGLILLGGPMNVDAVIEHPFLQPERAFIQQCFHDNVPIFGICLGAQLLARSLGARVEKNTMNGEPLTEIGWTPISLTEAGRTDPVLSQLGEHTAQFQWHEDTFHLPPGATLLASTPSCPRQAYCIGPKVYGMQFHPEVTPAIIQQWLTDSKSLPQTRAAQVWADTESLYPTTKPLSQRMFRRFWEQALSAS